MKENEKKEPEKKYARLLNDDFLGLNLKNNVKFFPTDYILRCIDGVYDNKQIRLNELGDVIEIGSDPDCNFRIIDSEISPKHCKLTYIPNTIYYALEDYGSTNGTWKKLSFFDDGMEITETTQFKIFQNEFVFEKNETTNVFTLKFTEGILVGQAKVIEDDTFDIGKKDCLYEITMGTENLILRVQRINNKVFVHYISSEITNEGYYYKLLPNQKVLLRAEDCIKIGENIFRLLVHNWGVTSEIGDKHYQEDTFTIIDDLKLFDNIVVPFYAVFDGHGGSACSHFLKNIFHKNLRYIIRMREVKDSVNFFNDFCKAVQEAVVYTDIQYLDKEKIYGLHQGSTAICLFFIGNKVISCNLGDSLSILVKKDSYIYLSRDLKPDREKEKERILKKNGYISADGRILSMISVSRAFGDWKLKDPKKSDSIKKTFQLDLLEIEEYLMGNRAEFRIYEINPEEDEYIILASDGIFQHHQPQVIFDYISKYYKQEKVDLTKIKNLPGVVDNLRVELISNLYGTNSTEKKNVDNMSLILIHLQNDKV